MTFHALTGLLFAVAVQGPALSPPLQTHQLASTTFGNTRTLRVLLPRDYDAPANRERRYPVLYLNDGQNLFDSTTAMFGPLEWRVDETVDSLVASNRIPALIVVGIDNGGRRQRAREYLPYVDKYLEPPEPAPQGKLYPRFLRQEVMPIINTHYRTLTDPAHTGLGGSSYGALISLYTALSNPGVFGRLSLESPSLYVDDQHILKAAAAAHQWPDRVYLGMGTNEGNRPSCDSLAAADPEPVADANTLAALLRRGPAPPACRSQSRRARFTTKAPGHGVCPPRSRFFLGPDVGTCECK